MSRILSRLREAGPRSRATLAGETSISKTAISTIISDLEARGLVTTGGVQRDGHVGRPGAAVELDGRHLVGLGVEISNDHLILTGLDLRGHRRISDRVTSRTADLPPEQTISAVATLIKRATVELARQQVQVIGVAVAAPGTVESATGTVVFSPNVGWENVPLGRMLRDVVDPAIPITVENDAYFEAVAEYALAPSDVRDLLCLTGDVGIGGGIIAGGHPLRGHGGVSGELGHMSLDPSGKPCKCGSFGCWEGLVSLAAFLERAADPSDRVRDPGIDLEERLWEIRRRATEGDERVLGAIAAVSHDLARGLSVVVKVLDPGIVVLGGYFSYLADFLVEPVQTYLHGNRLAGSRRHCTLIGSTLGFAAPSTGGATTVLDRVFDDPLLVGSSADRRPA